MLRKFILLAWLWSQSIGSYAFSAIDFPSNFLIKAQKNTKTIDLIVEVDKIGSLIPKSTRKNNGIFYFYDSNHTRKITLRHTGYNGMLGNQMYMDVFDDKQNLVAKIMYYVNISHNRMNRFVVYEPDGKTKWLTVSSNAVGTFQRVYYRNTWTELAVLHRNLFTWSLDTEVKITNSYQILTSMDPNVFAAVLAFYSYAMEEDMNYELINKEITALLVGQIQKWAENSNLTYNMTVSESVSQRVLDTLNRQYQERYDDSDLLEEDKIIRFVNFALELLQTGVFSHEEEQALYQFLMERLKPH